MKPSAYISVSGAQRKALVTALCACGLLAASLTGPAGAAALGGPDVRSSLNQPLRVRLAVTLRDGEDLAPTCVRAVAPKRDDLPMVPGARASLQRDDRGVYVLYSSAAAMTEPALRGAVEVGCTDPVVREFVVLLDPPAVTLPQSLPQNQRAESAAEPVAPARATAPASASSAQNAAPATAPAASRARPVTQVKPRTARPVAAAPRQPKAVSATPKMTDRLTLTAPGAGATGLLGADSGLKLSDLLSRLPQADAAEGDPAQARQLAVEQARLAAILRDEDPFAAAQAKEKELSDRLVAMNRDLTAVRNQVTELAQRNRELERFAWFKWVVWALAGLMALIAAFFALRALRDLLPARRKQKEDPWWNATQTTVARNPVTTVEHLYRDTIKPVPARSAAQPGLEAATTSFD
ncbi:MAG: type IV pilus assembly protein FimV, partial [Burkholderiaceae bacterium]